MEEIEVEVLNFNAAADVVEIIVAHFVIEVLETLPSAAIIQCPQSPNSFAELTSDSTTDFDRSSSVIALIGSTRGTRKGKEPGAYAAQIADITEGDMPRTYFQRNPERFIMPAYPYCAKRIYKSTGLLK